MLRFLFVTMAMFAFIRTSHAVCTEEQQIAFVSGIPNGLTCGLAIRAANETPTGTAGMQSLDTICTESCAGAVAQWLANPMTCDDKNAVASLSFWCQPADGGKISRCRYAFDQIDPAVFNNVNIKNCSLFGSTGNCSSACSDGLQAMASEIGCCYQLIYNNSMLLDSQEQTMMITAQQRMFFALLSNSDLWASCNVDIPGACISPTYRMDAPAPATVTLGLPNIVTTKGSNSNIIGLSITVFSVSFGCALMF